MVFSQLIKQYECVGSIGTKHRRETVLNLRHQMQIENLDKQISNIIKLQTISEQKSQQHNKSKYYMFKKHIINNYPLVFIGASVFLFCFNCYLLSAFCYKVGIIPYSFKLTMLLVNELGIMFGIGMCFVTFINIVFNKLKNIVKL